MKPRESTANGDFSQGERIDNAPSGPEQESSTEGQTPVEESALPEADQQPEKGQYLEVQTLDPTVAYLLQQMEESKLLTGVATTVAELEAAVTRGDAVDLKPDGTATITPTLGQQPDGSFKVVLTIPEGYIEMIREEANNSQQTVEQWVSGQFGSTIESWWSRAQGR
jgi:hypothetical protein